MRLWEVQQAMRHHQEKVQSADSHRPRLTLRHLHKLRKMREQQAMDRAAQLQFVQVMYTDAEDASPPEPSTDDDQWQKQLSKTALRAIKDKQRQQEKDATEVQSNIKERRKKTAATQN